MKILIEFLLFAIAVIILMADSDNMSAFVLSKIIGLFLLFGFVILTNYRGKWK